MKITITVQMKGYEIGAEGTLKDSKQQFEHLFEKDHIIKVVEECREDMEKKFIDFIITKLKQQ